MNLEPLKSAEPPGIVPRRRAQQAEHEAWGQETLDDSARGAPEEADRPGAEEQPLTAEQREAALQEALGLTPETVGQDIPDQVLRIRENIRTAQAKIDDLRDKRVPSADHEAEDLGLAWDVLAGRERDAIIQPPKPEIRPSTEILQRAQERESAHEPEPA